MFLEKTKSLRRITAVLHITTEAPARMELARSSEKKKQSLKQHLLEKMKTWINGLLEGERDEFLGRDRHVPLDEGHDNYRNGYRPRRINFFGLGKIELKVPRDRKGELESQWLPERKGQDPELEAFLAEAFLAGLSTRDLARISEKHLGHKYDSKQISRIVGRATTELEAWRRRCCQGQRLPAGSQTGAGTVLQRSQRDLLCSHPECGAGRFLRSEAAMGAAVSFGGADH